MENAVAKKLQTLGAASAGSRQQQRLQLMNGFGDADSVAAATTTGTTTCTATTPKVDDAGGGGVVDEEDEDVDDNASDATDATTLTIDAGWLARRVGWPQKVARLHSDLQTHRIQMLKMALNCFSSRPRHATPAWRDDALAADDDDAEENQEQEAGAAAECGSDLSAQGVATMVRAMRAVEFLRQVGQHRV
jgi:hypothetical protein